MSTMLSAGFGNPLQALQRFLRDRRGIAATEFALIVPVMILLLIGVVELTRGVAADRKIGLVARAIADLSSQATTISNNDMENILDVAEGIMYPYSISPLGLRVTAVNVAANGTTKVAWSAGRNLAKYPTGSTVTIPAALRVANTQVIWGEAQYNYDPELGVIFFNHFLLKEQNFVRPRLGDSIKGPT